MIQAKKTIIGITVLFFTLMTLTAEKSFRIAVFVPGKVKGNPTYEMLAEGAKEAKDILAKKQKKVQVSIIESGVNQGEWLNSLTGLALSKKYDIIVSSNPSLPALAEKVLETVPSQKFLLLDGFLAGNKNIKTISFNQYEQGYLNGYYAALISTSTMPRANSAYKIGLLAGQEFPVMNNKIRKGFLDGAKAVDNRFEVDFRVLGNWYDAAKAADIAASMIKNGSDVILTICGGGNAGTVSAAREHGAYVMWFDSPGYRYGAEVAGGTNIALTAACRDTVIKAAEGSLDYGTPSELGIADGAVSFAFDGIPASVSPDIIAKERTLLENIKAGTVTIEGK